MNQKLKVRVDNLPNKIIDDIEEIIRDPYETDMDWQYEDQPFQSEVENVDDSQSRNTVTWVRKHKSLKNGTQLEYMLTGISV